MTEKNTSIRTKTRHPADFLTYIAIYVCAIILVMLLIYAAICYLEWRLAQKEEWWKGMILPIVFLLLGRGGRFLGIILLVIYGLQRNKLQKEQNKIEE